MKRKIQISSLFFLASFASSFASTNVPSAISSDTQWDSTGSPYVIQGKVTVAKGATLRVGPNVKVVFQGAAAMEVNGTLNVEASAAAPAVFDMSQGGLGSELFINGGEAGITNTKILSGVFLVQDSKLRLQWFEMTKGSGLYLRGDTTATVKNGKIYGNATGVVLDGKVRATLEFDTITQNTYGLYLKSFSGLEFQNNSVHDNDKDVVNNTPALKLAGNYWGTDDPKAVQAKVQGSVDVAPMKSLKDILRFYVKTQLPPITKEMSIALVKKEKAAAAEEARKAKETGNKTAQAPATAAAPATEAVAPSHEQTAPEAVPETPAAPAEAEISTSETQTAKVKSLPPAPHSLKPLALPPDQGNVAESAAAAPPSMPETQSAESPSTPPPATAESSTTPPAPSTDIPLPPSATAGTETLPPPPKGASASTAPPAPPADKAASTTPSTPPASDNSVPIPPEVSGSTAPPAPPAGDVIAPPDIESSTAPPAPSAQAPASNNAPATSTSKEAVPPPPDLNEQVPPSTPASSQSAADNTTAPPTAPPVPRVSTVKENTAPAATAPPPGAQQAPATSLEDQQKAAQALDGVSGDIDGMQAPPLDLGIDVAPTNTEAASTATSSNKSKSPKTKKSNGSNLMLPPLKDADVAPPKDLDLPPTDDLGNINLDSRNK